MNDKRHLEVSAIKNGTVIDHIPSESLFKVISILALDKVESQITFGNNLESKRMGSKAIIKIANVFFRNDDINRIALVAPEAKLNIIRDYAVVDKMIVEVPEQISGIARCVNPKCITNNENIVTRFTVVKKDSVSLKCHYCERITDQEHMDII